MSITEQPTQWTVDTLKEYLLALREADHALYTTRFIAVETATTNALNAADRAVTKAETATEKRFEGVNEFRSTLADQQRNLMPRSEAEAIEKGHNDKIEKLTKQVDGLIAERSGVVSGYGYAVGVVGVVLGVIGVVTWVVNMTAGTP